MKSVYADPTRDLKAVTVMFKRERGDDADNLDWFWARYRPDGTLFANPGKTALAGRIGKNATAGCIACHKALGGADLVTLTTEQPGAQRPLAGTAPNQ